MDVEFLQLARGAVAALQTGPPPNWAEVVALFVSAAVGFGQIGLIAWGLRQMRLSGERRDRQLDIMETNQRELAQTLRQQGEALGKIGQALERQGEAMTQVFTQQGEVLAELLRRRA